MFRTFFAVMFPWMERVAEKLNFAFFDKNLLAYYKRLIDSVIKSKKEAKTQANNLNCFYCRLLVLIHWYSTIFSWTKALEEASWTTKKNY